MYKVMTQMLISLGVLPQFFFDEGNHTAHFCLFEGRDREIDLSSFGSFPKYLYNGARLKPGDGESVLWVAGIQRIEPSSDSSQGVH